MRYLFGLRNNRKGDWKRENTFWNNLGQPAYTGHVRYERDYKTERTPSAQTTLSPSNQPSRRFLPHLGRPRTSPRKRREGDRIGEGLHQDWRPEDLDFSSPSHISSQGTLIMDLVRSTWSMHDFKIPSVNMLHWWYRSTVQSLELIRDGLNRGTLVRVAGGPYRTCPVLYRTCPVWPSRAGSLLPLIQCHHRIVY